MSMPKLTPVEIKPVDGSWFSQIRRWLSSTRKWLVTEDWFYTLPEGVTIMIPAGFIFDGASIPKMFRGLLSPTGILFIPGLVHDYAYKYNYLIAGNIRFTPKGDSRLYWDTLFRDISNERNKLHVIGATVYYSVRAFGWIPWNKHRKNER